MRLCTAVVSNTKPESAASGAGTQEGKTDVMQERGRKDKHMREDESESSKARRPVSRASAFNDVSKAGETRASSRSEACTGLGAGKLRGACVGSRTISASGFCPRPLVHAHLQSSKRIWFRLNLQMPPYMFLGAQATMELCNGNNPDEHGICSARLTQHQCAA